MPAVLGDSSYTDPDNAPTASFWVGLSDNVSIIQAGADSIATSTPEYRFWIEDYNSGNPSGTGLVWDGPTITAGQTAYISITYNGNATSDFFLENQTTEDFTPVPNYSTPYVPSNPSALFINERPMDNAAGGPYMPNYGSSEFSGCYYGNPNEPGQIWTLDSSSNEDVMTTNGLPTGFPLAQPGPVADGDFTVDGTNEPKVLVMGDSISNGWEGAYTWRYRLWQHLNEATSDAQFLFVGHRSGTEDMYDNPSDVANINGTPPPADSFDADPTDGTYRVNTWASNHDAVWGWPVHLAMGEAESEVSSSGANCLIIELGINDIIWGINSPSGTIGDIGTLIANARAANPNLRIVVANLLHTIPNPQFPYINPDITTFNDDLPSAVAGWSTSQSPVVEADISSNYDPDTDTYDGVVHPNGVGEYIIAAGFENALSTGFGLGASADPVPSSVPELTMTAPPSITASTVPQGILIQWGHTYGATGYYLYSADVTAGAAGFTSLPLPVQGDHWYDRWVLPGHTYDFYVTAVHGDGPQSPASATASAVANPDTVTGPSSITDVPGQNSIAVSWPAVSGSDGTYEVLWSDQSSGVENIGAQAVNGTSYTVTGLTNGDTYGIAVVAYNQYGGGYPGLAMPAIPGEGTPSPAPVMQSVAQIDATDADLTWTNSSGAAAWWIYQSSPPDGLKGPFTQLPYPAQVTVNATSGTDTWTAGWLLQTPISEYAYKVQACNGSYCTALSNAMAVTPITAGSASPSLSAAPLTPQQQDLRAFFGKPISSAQADALAMRHRQFSAGS
jgi:hypothetical protein